MLVKRIINCEEVEVEIDEIQQQTIPQKKREVVIVKREIDSLKSELAEYDYIGVKIAMGVATKEEYADKIAYTETLRLRIRELEDAE